MGVIRLTTTLASLGDKENIRVNCLIPGWIASEEVLAYVASLPLAERAPRGVPTTLISLDQVADAVVRLATDENLAGRLLLIRNDVPAALIAESDVGYGALDSID
jgi:NAD(P)-dependent dehydrogenase (short-subunit alcohol dehydrogenase family)